MATRKSIYGNSAEMAAIGNALSKFVEARQTQQQIDARGVSSTKQPDLKDVILMSMLKKQGMLDEGTIRAYTGGDDKEQQIATRLGTTRKPEDVAYQQVLSSQGLSGLSTNPVYINAGMKASPYESAQLDVNKAESTQKALIPGKVEEAIALTDPKAQADAASLMAREAAEMRVSLERVTGSALNVSDSFVKVADELYRKTGLKPGLVAGVANKIAPAQFLELKNQFRGAALENAAQVASVAIPGVRASRVISIFTKDAPTEFDTIESGVANISRSLRGAFIKDIIQNPTDYGIERNLSTMAKAKIAETIAEDISKKYEDDTYSQVYAINKGLFRNKEAMKRGEEAYNNKDKKQELLRQIDAELLGA